MIRSGPVRDVTAEPASAEIRAAPYPIGKPHYDVPITIFHENERTMASKRVPTSPYPDQKPGTSGLRKKVRSSGSPTTSRTSCRRSSIASRTTGAPPW